MNDGVEPPIGLMIIVVSIGCLILGICVGEEATIAEWKQLAIEHNAAHYHRDTGAFEWNEAKKVRRWESEMEKDL